MNLDFFDIQHFASDEPQSSADTLKLVGGILNQLGFKNIADITFNYEPNDEQTNVNVHPLLNFVGNFLYKEAEADGILKKDEDLLTADQTQFKTYMKSYATLFTKGIKIIDTAVGIIQDFDEAKPNKPNMSTISNKIASIVDDIGFMGAAISDLHSIKIDSKKSKTAWLLPILTSSVALVFNGLTAIDGISKDDRLNIEQSYLKFLNKSGTAIVKQILSNAVANEFEKIKNGDFDDIEIVKTNATFLTSASKMITKTIGVFYALARGAAEGINKYKTTLAKYKEDDIPEDLAKRDAVVNAVASFIHDLASYYTKGFDDLIFVGTQNLVSWMTGKEPKIQGNYVEVLTDVCKAFNYTNSGTSKNDYLLSYENASRIYAKEGNDSIHSFYSNVTIWSGDGNDYTNLREGSSENGVFGGPGRDTVEDSGQSYKHSIYGGLGEDRIQIKGDKNVIDGGADKDNIWILGGTENTINGGQDDDTIAVFDAEKSFIYYSVGDGNDKIYGYSEDHQININTFAYSTVRNGNDLIINISEGSITLVDYKGDVINLNGKKIGDSSSSGDDTVEPVHAPIFPNQDTVNHDPNDEPEDDTSGKDTETTLTAWATISNDTSETTVSTDDNVANGSDSCDTIRTKSIVDDTIGHVINGNGGDDYIVNDVSNATIYCNSGDDTIISGSTSRFRNFINAGDGNNYIEGSGTITAGDGDDTIKGSESINAGKGNNYIEGYGTISTGDDNDTIKGSGLINAGKGNNYISVRGGTITSGSGNDTIHCYDSSINAGDGDNYVSIKSYSTIVTGNGNDTIYGSGSINAGAGNNYIEGYGIITTGYDDDTIQGGGSINAGDGNNYIRVSGGGSTITAGSGNDTIYSSYYSSINAGDGNNYIEGYGTISTGDGDDTIQGGGSINAGDGNNYVSIKPDYYSTVVTGNDNDTIYGDGLINTGNGDDIIYGSGSINAGAGNNYIEGSGTITTGNGDDTIFMDENSSINAGDGNNYVSIKPDYYSTIVTGNDNDTIYVNGLINAGNGNNYIEGSGTITTGDGNDTIYSGDGLINAGNGNNYVSIKRYYSYSTIVTGNGDDTIFTDNSSSINAGAGNNYVSVTNTGNHVWITAGSGNDTIISQSTYEYGPTINVNAGDGNNLISLTGSGSGHHANIISGRGADSIYVDLNDNLGERTYSDEVNINVGNGNDYIQLISKGGIRNQGTITCGEGDDTIINQGYCDNVYIYNNGDGNDLIQGLHGRNTLIIGTGLDTYSTIMSDSTLIIRVGDGSISLQGATNSSSINIQGRLIEDKDSSSWATITSWTTFTVSTSNTIANGTDSNDEIKVASITDDMVGRVINGNDGNDSIHSSVSGATISGGNGNDQIVNDGGSNVSIIGEDGNDQIGNRGSNVNISSGNGDDTIFNGSDSESVRINSGDGDDSIQNFGVNVTINGGAGKDSIYNQSNNVSINGGNGNDTIFNNGGNNVTISGGNGDDTINLLSQHSVIEYEEGDGNDIIVNFHEDDTLIISGTNYSTVISDNDVIVTAGSGKITLQGVASLSSINIQNQFVDATDTTISSGWATITNANGTTKVSTADTVANGTDINDTIAVASIAGDTIENTARVINGNDGADLILNGDAIVMLNDSTAFPFSIVAYDFLDFYDESIESLSDLTINGGNGDDAIYNDFGFNVLINSGDGNDFIHSGGDNVTIKGGTGDDTIRNYKIKSRGNTYEYNDGDGNDFIKGFTSEDSLIINGNRTEITRKNDGDIIVGVGNNTITIVNYTLINLTSDTIITGTSYGDSIENYGKNVTINGGEGNDFIYNHVKNVTINGGEGNDTIRNADGDTVQVSGGNGNDLIYNLSKSNYVTIEGGTGNDTIYNSNTYAGGNIYQYNNGDGNDVIRGMSESDTLIINGTTYSTTKSGDDIIVTAGDGAITLQGSASISPIILSGEDTGSGGDTVTSWATITNDNGTTTVSTADTVANGTEINDTIAVASIAGDTSNWVINGNGGDDSIRSSVSGATISGGDGSDYIYNRGSNVTISGGLGNDYIYNYYGNNITINGNDGSDTVITHDGDNISINGEIGNDYIHNEYGNNITINGGDGSDTIYNYDGENSMIIGGKGNDSISVSSYISTTINGGTGDDTISLSKFASLNVIEYENGDGNDIITGFKSSDTLIINGTTYSTTKSADDIIVTAGDGSITLKDAATLTSFNINGTLSADDIVVDWATLTTADGTTTISTDESIVSGTDNADTIITALIANDTISRTVSAGAGNDNIQIATANISVDAGTGDDTINTSSGNATISGDDGKDLVIVNNSTAAKLTLTDFSTNDTIKLSSSVTSINFDDTTKTLNVGDDLTIALPNIEIVDSNATWDVSDTSVICTLSEKSGFNLTNGTNITYSKGTAPKTLTISGLKDGLTVTDGKIDGIDLSGTTVTLASKVLGQTKVTITDGYTLELGKDVATAKYDDPKFDNFTYKAGGNTAGYKLANNEISYVEASSETTELFTLTGVKSTDGITVSSDNTVTLTEGNLNETDVTISNSNYKLALDKDYSPKVTAAHFEELIYKSESHSTSYTLADNVVTYSSETSATDLFTLTGVKSTDGITVENSTVTLTASNLNESDVTISNANYKLALDKVDAPKYNAEGFTAISGGTSIYQTANNTAGYTLADNKISYIAKVDAENLVTVSNVTSTDGLIFDKAQNILTIASNFGGVANVTNNTANDLTVTNGTYNLTLATNDSLIAGADRAYQNSTLYIDGATLTNVSSITTATEISLANGILKLSADATVNEHGAENATVVTGDIKQVTVGKTPYDVENSELVMGVTDFVVKTVQVDGTTITLLNAEGQPIPEDEVKKSDYATISNSILNLQNQGKSAGITISNAGSEPVKVNVSNFIANIGKGGTINGVGANLTGDTSWLYSGTKLTASTFTLENIGGITSDTSISISGNTANIEGTGISYKGVTLNSGAMAATTEKVTLNDGANATLANNAAVDIEGNVFANVNINGIAVRDEGDGVKATLDNGALILDGEFDCNESLYISAGTISVATDTKAVTLNDGANAFSSDSNKELALATGAKVTINNVAGISATDTKIQPLLSGISFTPNTGAVSYNNMTFSGGKAGISHANGEITLYDNAAVTNANDKTFTVNKAATVNLDGKTFTAKGSNVKVTSAANGLKVGNESVSVNGDENYTVTAAIGDIQQVSRISSDATVTTTADTLNVVTDSAGKFAINDRVVTISGDNSVVFGIESDTVKSVSSLEGAVSGDFNKALEVDGGKVQILGDENISVTANGKVTNIEGVGDGATVSSSGGASSISTDMNGTFNFPAQIFNVNDNNNTVTFLVENESVKGTNEIENGTLGINQDASLKINGNSVTFGGVENSVSLTTADGSITAVENLSGLVNGLSNATVSVIDNDVTINSAAIQINEGESTNLSATVADGKLSAIDDLNNGATVKTAKNLSISTAEQGVFNFPKGTYSISGDDSVTFITDANSNVTDIENFAGTLKSSENNVTVNGEAIYTSNTDATIVSSGGNFGEIRGLVSGDTVNAPYAMSVHMDCDTSVLTVNGRDYRLSGDGDGIIISGNNNPIVKGLAANASLTVGAAGSYNVNDTTLNANIGDIIIGDPEGTAHIYDSNDVNFTEETPVEEIVNKLTGNSETEKIKTTNSEEAISDGNLSIALSNSDTSTAQTTDLTNTTGTKNVTLEDGDQNLSFNDAGKNVATVPDNATGEKNINLGNGGDIAVIGKTESPVNVKTGKGADQIISAALNLLVDLAARGATKIMATRGTVQLKDYDPTTGAGIQLTNSDIVSAILNKVITFGNGKINTGVAEINLDADAKDEGASIVNLFNLKGKKTKVSFTHSGGGTADLSQEKENLLLLSNGNGGSSMSGGSGNDTGVGGAGDTFDMGEGDNHIELDSNRNDSDEGATIKQTATKERTQVNGFNFGFGGNHDKVSISTDAQVSYSNGKIIFKIGQATLTLNLVGSSADLADGGSSQKVLIGEGNSAVKLEVAEKDSVIRVSDNEEERATSYVGENSGINLDDISEDTFINLNEGNGTLGQENLSFRGITKLQGGTGNNSLVGSANTNNTIVAGVGNTSIWGAGESNDSLVGSTSSLKSGSTTFFFADGDGHDVITNFEFLTSENKNTADKVDTYGGEITGAELSGNDVIIEFANMNDRLKIKDARGKNIQVNDIIAQVNTDSLNYDGVANYFMATGKNATVTVNESLTNAEVWLNSTFDGDIKYLDASKVEGKATLAGNENNNVILAAQGGSSLWGGSDSESNDTLRGGNGADIFWYGKNEGNDVIQNVDGGDIVNLYNLKLDDISNASVNSTEIQIATKFGNTLTVESKNSGVGFKLSDGEIWTVNQNTHDWSKK